MKNSISVTVFVRTPNSKQDVSLWLSIKTDTDRFRFSTGFKFNPAYLNYRGRSKTRDIVKRATALSDLYKQQIDLIKATAHKAVFSLLEAGYSLSKESIKTEYDMLIGNTRKPTDRTFYEYFDQWQQDNERKWSTAFKKLIASFKSHLHDFDTFRGKTTDWPLINQIYWSAFSDYLITKKNMQNSSANKYLSKLLMFLRSANANGIFNPDYSLVVFKFEKQLPKDEIALTESQINQIRTVDLSQSQYLHLESIRAIFLLSVYCGQRISDLRQILKSIYNTDGVPEVIQLQQTKTKTFVTLPVFQDLEHHIRDMKRKFPTGIHIKQDQVFNRQLKDLCKLAGLNEKTQVTERRGKDEKTVIEPLYDRISSHTARRTFATLALSKGIPANLVMQLTGHKNLVTFSQYVKRDLSEVTKQFDQKFKLS